MTKTAKKKLTPKQRLFVLEYAIDQNATQAAIRAGYSEKTAYSQGQRLLKKVEISEAIAKNTEKRAEKLEITADNVAKELAKIGFANMEDYIRLTDDGDAYVNLSELTRDQAAAISEITIEDYKEGRGPNARDIRKTKFKLSDKKSALDSLAKHLGMFKDQVEHSGEVKLQTLPWEAMYGGGDPKPGT